MYFNFLKKESLDNIFYNVFLSIMFRRTKKRLRNEEIWFEESYFEISDKYKNNFCTFTDLLATWMFRNLTWIVRILKKWPAKKGYTHRVDRNYKISSQ